MIEVTVMFACYVFAVSVAASGDTPWRRVRVAEPTTEDTCTLRREAKKRGEHIVP